jgi:chromate transporter
MDAEEFEDANAAGGLLPGPASTQLAILCAYRVAGPAGAIVGGLGFVVPAIVMILAAVGAVSRPLTAAVGSRRRRRNGRRRRRGGRARSSRADRPESRARSGWPRTAAALERVRDGGCCRRRVRRALLVLVLFACGAVECTVRRPTQPMSAAGAVALLPGSVSPAGLGALAWRALKVGALSFGGGFVIVPLMQNDAVHAYH